MRKMFTANLALTLAALVWLFAGRSSSTVTVTTTRPVVSTTSGVLRGVRTLVDGRFVDRYLGVPYAQAPVGALRFRPSLPIAGDVARTVDASRFRESCMQPPHLRQVIYTPLHQELNESFVSEDCLYLNVYVPQRRGDKLATMVWLPGEGFDYGYANQYDGSYLAAHGNVVVVTVNYRLSVFGFLATGDDAAPGNVGLRDQLLALRWLEANVARLGGDPDKLTAFGRLTGSVSISALLASPHTRRVTGDSLLSGAILQSGVAHGDWVFERNPLEQAKSLAIHANCSDVAGDTSRLLECLRRVPAAELLRMSFSAVRPWRLVVDGDFLPQEPLRAELPHVAVMLGNAEHEGSMCFLEHLVTNTSYTDKIKSGSLTQADLSDLVDRHLGQYFNQGDVDDRLAESVVRLYSCNDSNDVEPPPSDRCRQQFLEFCGHLLYDSAVVAFADRLAQAGDKVYRYRFLHRPSFSHYPDFISAAQGDEVLFVFGLVEDPTIQTATDDEVRLSRRMMKAWSNFAKTGNPNPIKEDVFWPAYNVDKLHLEISTKMDETSVKSTSDDRLDFWLAIHNSTSAA